MPDVDEFVTSLRSLPDRPPVAPRPVDDIARRARRARHGRRARRGVGAAVTIAAAVVIGVNVVGSSPTRVEVGPATTPTTVTLAPSRGMSVTPSTGLEDGTEVDVQLANDPGGEFAVAQCAIEAVDAAAAVDWCDSSVQYLRSPAGTPTTTFQVARVMETTRGLIDCAETARRCVIGVRGPTSTPDRYAAISFRSDLPPVPIPELALGETDLDAGDIVTVRADGFPVSTEVVVMQCLAIAAGAAGADDFGDCDMARAKQANTDTDGRFTTDFLVAHEMLTYDGWEPCDPCTLRAFTPGAPAADIALAIAGTIARPSVRIVEPSPYAPEQPVTLEGRGFQVGDGSVTIGRCSNATARDCSFPSVGFVATDRNGALRVEGYPLTCGGNECVLAWHPGEGAPSAFVTPYTITR
jgi:hypothetical protein